VKVTGLLIALATLLAACAGSAGAEVRLGETAVVDVSEVASPVGDEEAVEPGAAVVLVSGPVRYVGPDGSYRIRVEWTQQIRHRDVNVELDATIEILVSPQQGGAAAARPDETGKDVEGTAKAELTYYSVTGDVRYNVSDASCHATGVGQVCGFQSVTDATVRGTATLDGSDLTVSIGWSRFGQDQAEGRPGAVVARWSESDSIASPLATIELGELGEALEAAGLIGGSFVIDINRFSPRNLRGTSSLGSGTGLLELVPQ